MCWEIHAERHPYVHEITPVQGQRPRFTISSLVRAIVNQGYRPKIAVRPPATSGATVVNTNALPAETDETKSNDDIDTRFVDLFKRAWHGDPARRPTWNVITQELAAMLDDETKRQRTLMIIAETATEPVGREMPLPSGGGSIGSRRPSIHTMALKNTMQSTISNTESLPKDATDGNSVYIPIHDGRQLEPATMRQRKSSDTLFYLSHNRPTDKLQQQPPTIANSVMDHRTTGASPITARQLLMENRDHHAHHRHHLSAPMTHPPPNSSESPPPPITPTPLQQSQNTDADSIHDQAFYSRQMNLYFMTDGVQISGDDPGNSHA